MALKDFGAMMKQAQQLQARMAEVQSELEQTEIAGTSGGGMVTVRLNGKGELKGVSIDPSLMKPDEVEILEDLLVAAHASAKAKVEAAMQEAMQKVAGGLPLPPGMKLF